MEFYKLFLILTIASTLGAEPSGIQAIINEEIYENIIVVDLNDGVVQEEVQEADPEPIDNESNGKITTFNVNGINLREGITSEEVFRLKNFLIEKDYMNINVDYYFDSKTKQVIMDYQRNNGLASDGIVGKATYEMINNDMLQNNIDISRINLNFTKEIPQNKWIIINKNNNTLYYLRGSNILNRYPVATGKNPGNTPEGQFTIVTKVINPAWGGAGRYTPVKGGEPHNPLGKRWMGLSVGGGGMYGIHGNADSSSIGKYISLGCIRMVNKDVEFLYNEVELRTPVWIGNELKLKEFGVEFN